MAQSSVPEVAIQQPGKTQFGLGVVGNVPPGCEYLMNLDQVIIKQVVELLEVIVGWECKNRYSITNSMDQQCYFATEESEVCMRQFCGNYRDFIMHITDNNGAEVIRINRPFKCCSGCAWCATPDSMCSQECEIEAPVGQVVGYAKQMKTGFTFRLGLYNANREHIFTMHSPCCVCQAVCCRDDVNFPIYAAGDETQQICNISKQWNGCVKDTWTNANQFGVSFPVDLDVKMKAVVLGATFLLDFFHFEQQS